jgi:CheY-like chemotaxis protein
MGQAQQKRRTVLIVEDDAELRSLMAALFEDEQIDTLECESAEAALATLLIGGREVAMIFADVRLRGVMDGIDLAREVKMRDDGRVAHPSGSHGGAAVRVESDA